jgi:hypothetical protein
LPTPQELEAAVIAEFNAAKAQLSDASGEVINEPVADALASPVIPAVTHAPGEPYQTKSGGWVVDIDLGDGGGVQKFKNPTLKGLISELAKAQTHASAKIRDLNRKIKEGPIVPDAAQPVKPLEAGQLTADEQWAIAQEMNTNPQGALEKLFEASVGTSSAEMREVLAAAREIKAKNAQAVEANKFYAAHPEYEENRENSTLMLEYLAKNNLAMTSKNFELAFEELTEAGLVTVGSKKAALSAAAVTPVEQSSTRTRKRGTVGISDRNSSVPDEDDEVTPNVLTVTDMLKLSPDERARIVQREFAANR